jgi:hypothetical protein
MAPDLHFSIYPELASAPALAIRPGTLHWSAGGRDRLALRFCFRPQEKIELGLWWNSEAKQPDVRLICGLSADRIEFGSLLGNGFDQPALQGRGFGTLAVNLAIEALQALFPAHLRTEGLLSHVAEDRLPAQERERLEDNRRAFWRRFGFRIQRDAPTEPEYISARVGELMRIDRGMVGGRFARSLSLRDFAPQIPEAP